LGDGHELRGAPPPRMAFCSGKLPVASRYLSKKLESIVVLETIAVCSEQTIAPRRI
jgi:hypothetical protein